MNTITIYGFNGSTYVRTVCMTCVEKGVDYNLEGFEFGSAGHAELHPFMKMPAADIEGTRLYETLAIASLIDDLSSPSLQPVDPVKKATMLKWISSAIDDLYPILVSDLLQDGPPSADSISNISKVLVLIDKEIRLKDHFLDGTHITLADLFLYPMLHFAASRVSDFGAMTAELECLKSWLALMDERECVIKTIPDMS
ncbi:MAG: glutathione S-transferase family protein [bacterium]